MAKVQSATATESKLSRKLVAEWSGNIHVGIYDSEWTVLLYEDRAIVRMPYVKWSGNTGGLDIARHRLVGRELQRLLEIARQQVEDSEDYTEQVKEIVWEL